MRTFNSRPQKNDRFPPTATDATRFTSEWCGLRAYGRCTIRERLLSSDEGTSKTMAERVTVIDGGQAVITAREERIFPVQSIGQILRSTTSQSISTVPSDRKNVREIRCPVFTRLGNRISALSISQGGLLGGWEIDQYT